jgi:EcoRII C terminal
MRIIQKKLFRDFFYTAFSSWIETFEKENIITMQQKHACKNRILQHLNQDDMKKKYLLTFTPKEGKAETIKTTINSIVFIEFENYKTRIIVDNGGHVKLEDITEAKPTLLKEWSLAVIKDSSFKEY